MRPQREFLVTTIQLLQGPAIAFFMLLGSRYIVVVGNMRFCCRTGQFATAQTQTSELHTQHPEPMNRIA
jgi:hypothetical protein